MSLAQLLAVVITVTAVQVLGELISYGTHWSADRIKCNLYAVAVGLWIAVAYR